MTGRGGVLFSGGRAAGSAMMVDGPSRGCALVEAVTLTCVGGLPGILVAAGLLFGFWPAAKAARPDPVIALRYEMERMR